MKAMILAAGLGQRMRPLTDHTPKPLLMANNQPLIEYHLYNLAAAGIKEAIINLAYLGEKIEAQCGNGKQYGLSITYSKEPEPLETAGAIQHALSTLGNEPFLLINGDVWSSYNLAQLAQQKLKPETLAHLLLVPNPNFHPEGDFGLSSDHILNNTKGPTSYTFSGISLIHPDLIKNYPNSRTKFPLGEVFRWAIANGKITGEVINDHWSDVGTPERLDELTQYLHREHPVKT